MSTIHPTATPSHAPKHNREYVHTASDGTKRVIFCDDSTGDRWYLLDSGRYTHAGFLPSTAAGRYAFDMYRVLSAESPRRAYRAMHDTYSLETPESVQAWDRARAERVRAERRTDASRARWGLTPVPRPLSRSEFADLDLYYSGRERSADDGRGL